MKFLKPENPETALRLKKENRDSYYLAGGTQLNSLYFSKNTIGVLISLERLGLKEIKKDYIGSMVTLEEIKTSSLLPESLKEAASHVVNRNIRNMATIGGNIGTNKSSSDMIPVLIALDAQIECCTETGRKIYLVSNWIKNPTGLILAIRIPHPDRAVFQKRFSRTKNDLPLFKIAIGADFENSRMKGIVMAAGCIAEKITTLVETSKFIEDKFPGDIAIEKLHLIAQSEINPIDDRRASADYRRHLLNVALDEFIKNRIKE